MSIPDNQAPESSQKNDKELNFRALEARYERKLAEERQARLELEQRLKTVPQDDDDSSDEPYVDHKKLEKKLARFGEKTKQETQNEIKHAVNSAIYEEKKKNWLDNNSDFYEVMEKAEQFAQQDPHLANTILEMPEGFERQKLVYYNIKSRGLDKPQQKAPSIQEKIDANRKSPYYQPSGQASAPYAAQGDYSPTGQKQAYEKLQELKRNLRI